LAIARFRFEFQARFRRESAISAPLAARAAGSSVWKWSDQDARSTVTMLNRGSRSTWTLKDQAARPSRERAKVGHGFCSYRDASFNLYSHVVAVTEKKFLHLLDGIG